MSDSRYLNGPALAARAKVSKAAISKQLKAGKLPQVTRNNKKVFDTQDIIIQEYIARNHEKKASSSSSDPPRAVKKKSPNNKSAPPQNNIDTGEDPNLSERYKLEMEKLRKQNEQLDIKNAAARGILVPREFVKKVFALIIGIDQSQFLQLPATIAARINGDVFGSEDPKKETEIINILTESVYNIQKSKKRVFQDELEKLEKEYDQQNL